MSDSNLTPDQDDAVRALLAAARHADPAPDVVVARLDDTRASLTADRREVRAPVVTLASRRRRTAATLLLAAAAVVVAGVGIGQILPSTNGGSDSSAGSAADTSTLDEAPINPESDQAYGAEPETKAGAGDDAQQGETSMRSQASAPAAVSGLSSDSALKPQVRKLRLLTADTGSNFSADSSCQLPEAESAAEPGDKTVVSVTYNGLPGVLVFRAPIGSTQQVDVFLCGEPTARRTLQLRAP